MEKTGIKDYYDYQCTQYFKIDYDKFLRKNLFFFYKYDDNRGVIRLYKSDYLRLQSGTQIAAFYTLLQKQNAHQEWDLIDVKDIYSLFRMFTVIGKIPVNLTFYSQIGKHITYREGSIRLNRTIELSFKTIGKIMSHPNKDSLFELLSSKDKANIELALILINNE